MKPLLRRAVRFLGDAIIGAVGMVVGVFAFVVFASIFIVNALFEGLVDAVKGLLRLLGLPR